MSTPVATLPFRAPAGCSATTTARTAWRPQRAARYVCASKGRWCHELVPFFTATVRVQTSSCAEAGMPCCSRMCPREEPQCDEPCWDVESARAVSETHVGVIASGEVTYLESLDFAPEVAWCSGNNQRRRKAELALPPVSAHRQVQTGLLLPSAHSATNAERDHVGLQSHYPRLSMTATASSFVVPRS